MSMEYDNDDHTWHRPPSPVNQRLKCQQFPKRSTTIAVVVLGLAILSCLLGYCVLSESLPYDSKTLRLVVILFRHGARTPTTTYKSDPYKNYQWPDGMGSLTNIGKLQLYDFGKKIRAYYGNFLPEEYFDKNLYTMSSDSSRCLMSAYTFLAGLYPPSERQMWHPEIPWQPVPVRSLPGKLDKTLAARKPCRVADAVYKELVADVNKDGKFAQLFEYLSKYTNQTMRSIVDVDYLYSLLTVQYDAGLKLPEWTKNVFPHKMREPAMLSLAMFAYNDTMRRLRAGPLLSEIKDHFEAMISKIEVNRNLYVYSAHDVTVVSLWRGLGLEELLLPEYGATLALELHELEETNHFVKVFYWNNTKIDTPLELKLEHCEDPCPYSQFSTFINNYIPENWENECRN